MALILKVSTTDDKLFLLAYTVVDIENDAYWGCRTLKPIITTPVATKFTRYTLFSDHH